MSATAIGNLSRTIFIGKSGAPVTLPKGNIFTSIQKGFAELFSGKSGKVVKVGGKVGAGLGLAGLGLFGLGQGAQSATGDLEDQLGFKGISGLLVIGIVIFIIFLLVTKK
jgi:hypothetical protein